MVVIGTVALTENYYGYYSKHKYSYYTVLSSIIDFCC